jgi:hypothetical protein
VKLCRSVNNPEHIVTIGGPRNSVGRIRISLFDSEESDSTAERTPNSFTSNRFRVMVLSVSIGALGA